MQQQNITFIVNGQVYKVDTNNRKSMQKIAAADRLQLIHALETLKNMDATEHQAQPELKTPPVPQMQTSAAQNNPRPHRTGSGDADLMMQQLIMEQKQQHKEIPDRNVIYKWFLIIFAVILLLVLIL